MEAGLRTLTPPTHLPPCLLRPEAGPGVRRTLTHFSQFPGTLSPPRRAGACGGSGPVVCTEPGVWTVGCVCSLSYSHIHTIELGTCSQDCQRPHAELTARGCSAPTAIPMFPAAQKPLRQACHPLHSSPFNPRLDFLISCILNLTFLTFDA